MVSKENAFMLLLFSLMFTSVFIVSSKLGFPEVPPNMAAVEILPSSGIYKSEPGYIFKVCSPEFGGCTKCSYDRVIRVDSSAILRIVVDTSIHSNPCLFYQVRDTSEIQPSYEDEKLQSDVRIKTINI